MQVFGTETSQSLTGLVRSQLAGACQSWLMMLEAVLVAAYQMLAGGLHSGARVQRCYVIEQPGVCQMKRCLADHRLWARLRMF